MSLLAKIAPKLAADRAAHRVRYESIVRLGEELEQRSDSPKRRRAKRRYEGASTGRRLGGWERHGSGPEPNGDQLQILRARSRDLVKNNAHAAQAASVVVANTVGGGIRARIKGTARAQRLWREWANTTACDADGRHDLWGLQALAMRAIFESGSVFVRARFRSRSEGLPVPLQIQVLEPDFLDRGKTGSAGTNRIINGIEYDRRGRRVAYYFFTEHPHSQRITTRQKTIRIDASSVAHVYRVDRPGQDDGAPWLAPVMPRLHHLAVFEDATIDKQKISACVAAFIHDDGEGAAPHLPNVTAGEDPDDPDAEHGPLEYLEPGIIEELGPGKRITFSNPPSSADFPEFVASQLRAIAAGIGIQYEQLTGDLRKTSFSTARIGWLEVDRRIRLWRQCMLIPGFCRRVFEWWALAAYLETGEQGITAEWTAPRREMLNPREEVVAQTKRIRGGLISHPEALRQDGHDPEAVLEEIAAWNARIDELGIVLDTDPRNTGQSGQTQAQPAANDAGDGDGDGDEEDQEDSDGTEEQDTDD